MSGFALLGGYIHEALLNLVSNELLGVQRFIVTGLLLLSGYAKLRDPIGAQ